MKPLNVESRNCFYLLWLTVKEIGFVGWVFLLSCIITLVWMSSKVVSSPTDLFVMLFPIAIPFAVRGGVWVVVTAFALYAYLILVPLWYS